MLNNLKMSCEACGGKLNEKQNGVYECECCLNAYTFDKAKEYADLLNQKLDSVKLEKLASLKNRLWRALDERYLSNVEIGNICEQIKAVDPDDLYANFFALACAESVNNGAIGTFLNEISASEKGSAVGRIIEFVLKSPELLEGCSVSLIKLIEGAYSRTSEQYKKYYTEYKKQMQLINECVFDVTLSRDAFIAYSSKDEKAVVELVDYLENIEGMSCFVSLRNLQHGSAAVENYEKQLEKAIDSCKVFVFVSSSNSRSNACDALKREIPYVMEKDRFAAGAYAQKSYDNISLEFKKARVEYVISDYTGASIAERKTEEFFAGIERVYDKQAVAERIFQATNKSFDLQSKLADVKNEQKSNDAQKENISFGAIREWYQTGEKYYYGLGVAENFTEAVKWYKKAAMAGDSDGQFMVGWCYQYGDGVEQSYVKALEWYKKAAEQGNDEAQDKLGDFYYYGDGVEKDLVKALEWYKKAAEQGNKDSEDMLCSLGYYNGDISEVYSAEAFKNVKSEVFADFKKKFERRLDDVINKNEQSIEESVPTLGVEYKQIKGKQEYFVNDYSHSGKYGVKIVIRDYYNDLPVTAIGKNAFFWSKKNIEEVFIPSTIRAIDNSAFCSCKALKHVDMACGVQIIGVDAFRECLSLKNIELPESVTQIKKYAFAYCTQLESIAIPKDVKVISNGTFFMCTALKQVHIPFGVTTIEKGAFYKCALKSLDIPESVALIEKDAFFMCEELSLVRFGGTKAQWNKINKHKFTKCNIICSDGESN